MASILATMGSSIPDPQTLDFVAWRNAGLISCLQACPIERTGETIHHYYFSWTDGDDTNAGDTADAPFQTITKFSQIITAHNLSYPGETAVFWFKRGDRWPEGEGFKTIYIDGALTEAVDIGGLSNSTFRSYGDRGKPNPLISTFTRPAARFTLNGSGLSYSIAWDESIYGPVGWLKNDLYSVENEKPMHSDTDSNLATLEALDLDDIPQGGFWYDTTTDTLHVRISDGSGTLIDPTGLIEVAPFNEVTFLESDDADGNCWCEIDVEGFGCFESGQHWGLKFNSSADNFNVIRDCSIGYAGKHAAGMYSGTGYSTEAGSGIVMYNVTVYGCNNGSPFVAYATNGTHQIFCDSCHCPWDTYPVANTVHYPDFNAGDNDKARAFYAHKGGGGSAITLFIANNCTTPKGNVYAPFEVASCADRPTAATLAACKVFIMNCSGEHWARIWQKGSTSIIGANQLLAGNHYIFHQVGATNAAKGMISQSNTVGALGWSFNCIMEHSIDGTIASPTAGTMMSFFNTIAGAENYFVNPHFKMRIADGLNNDCGLSRQDTTDDCEIVGGIFDFLNDPEGGGDNYCGVGTSITLLGNAIMDYMDDDEGGWQDTFTDAGKITLTTSPEPGAKPDPRGLLFQVGDTGSPSYATEYDFHENPVRPNRSVGPVEHHANAARRTAAV